LRPGRPETLRHRPIVRDRSIAQFETVPAWRITRLRLTLRDAEQRGRLPDDAGADLTHRALARRFALGRSYIVNPPRLAKTTHKGRNFPLAKRVAIWRAILTIRPPDWRQGDRAAFGAIVDAHRLAITECAALSLPPPRYRTVYMLWHRGVPGPEVKKALLQR
jgi:hypothetical protein